MKIILRLWSAMPMWLHVFAARLTRQKFRAAVAAIIFDEQGRILLFRHTYRKFEWGIPAGSLERQEQPEDAVKREFFEETGMQIKIKKLLNVVSAKEDRHLTAVFLCETPIGKFAPSHEVTEMRYFNINELPRMLFDEKDLIQWAANKLKENSLE